VATPTRQFDRAAIETQVFDIARDLLDELGNSQGHGSVRGSAHLDRDLGLGSLERVELLVRLQRAFGANLPEHVIAEADTLDDVIAALAGTSGLTASRAQTSAPAQWRDSEPLPQSDTGAAALSSAETWQEVIRYRASADAERPHLIFWEGGVEAHRMTFGELHAGALAVAVELGRRGIMRGDAVALMLPTGREFFLTFAGVLLAGGVPVPIYPPVRPARLQFA
jgi:fatty-acyl-CoA synthase